MSQNLKKVIGQLKPALDASLDAAAVVDFTNRIHYANVAMKNFLDIPARDFKQFPIFCNHVKLAVCEKQCQILHLMKINEPLRLDETPAARGTEKVRLLFKGVPLIDPDDPKITLGAVLVLRDSTGEILLQAKYHKVMQLLTEKDTKINELMDRLNALRTALRRARDDASA